MIKVEIQGIEDLIKFVEIIRGQSFVSSEELSQIIKKLDKDTEKLEDAVQSQT